MNLDLQKKLDLSKNIVVDLVKKTSLGNQKAKVVVVMDYSVSMRDMYRNGTVQTVLERLTPLAMQFDDDGEFELYLFHDGVMKAPSVTLANLDGFVKNKIDGKYNYGGTNYAPVINKIVKDYGNTSGGLLGMFGKGSSKPADLPTYVIYITDGENSDRGAAEKAIIEASKHGIQINFVGVGGATFNFLRTLDNLPNRLVDNASFFTVPNFKTVSDEVLYSQLLRELPQWILEARAHNLIK